MKENHVQEQLSAYLDRMLSPEENNQVESHLMGCAQCKKVLGELQGMVGWMKSVPKPSMNVGLEARLLSRLDGGGPSQNPIRSWMWLSGGLTTVMVSLLVFVMVRDNHMREQWALDCDYKADRRDSRRMNSDKASLRVRDENSMQLNEERNIAFSKSKSIVMESESVPSAVGGAMLADESSPSSPVILKSQLKMSALPVEEKAVAQESSYSLQKSVISRSKQSEQEFLSSPMGVSKSEVGVVKTQGRMADSIGMDAVNSLSDGVVGFSCAIKKSEQRVVRSQKEWKALLARMGSQAENAPFASVDFSKQMVVAVFMGEKNSAGHTIRIIKEEFHGEVLAQTLVIKFRQTHPAKGAMAAAVLTQPYHLKVLPLFQGLVQFQDEK